MVSPPHNVIDFSTIWLCCRPFSIIWMRSRSALSGSFTAQIMNVGALPFLVGRLPPDWHAFSITGFDPIFFCQHFR